ncbi:Phosphatidylinositol_3-kinase [Hexamita inflata]|uniref:Putative n=1 Tax=Hexamita inflata TaxID=28002 RepID=A0AA86S579_9EUKA|nr:Phosphatidylinositol 3-kinase [Hexamita inflata]
MSKSIAQTFNQTVQPTKTCRHNLAINIDKISIPRRHLLKSLVFSENLPIDIQVKVRLMKLQEEICPWIYTSFQRSVDFNTDYVVYGYNYLIEFPIAIQLLTPECSIQFSIEGYEIKMENSADLFKPIFEFYQLSNGTNSINIQDTTLVYEVRPISNIPIVFLQDAILAPYKKTYRPIQQELKITAKDFTDIANNRLSTFQFAACIEMEKQIFQFENYKSTQIEETVSVRPDILTEYQNNPLKVPINCQNVSPLNRNQQLDVIELIDTRKNNPERVLTDMVKGMNYSGILFQDNMDQVQYFTQNDYSKIRAYFQNEKQIQQPFYNKSQIDVFFQKKPSKYLQFEQLSDSAIQQPDYQQQQIIEQISKQNMLVPLSEEQAKLIQRFKDSIKIKQPEMFIRLVESSFICKEYNEQFFIDFKNVPSCQILLLFRNIDTRSLAMRYVSQLTTKDVYQSMMQLTLAVGDDIETELGDYLADICSQRNNIYLLSQFYFFLNCWKWNAVERNEKRVDKYEAAMQKYLCLVQKRSQIFSKEISQTIQLVDDMQKLIKTVKEQSQERLVLIELLRAEIKKNDLYPTLLNPKQAVMFPFIMRDNKPIYVKGVNPDRIHVFKSAKKPFLIALKEVIDVKEDKSPEGQSQDSPTEKATKETCILIKFKDDVRTDVMVLQLFRLMESQLRENNIQLEPSHYAAFAFDQDFGMIECVFPSISIDDIITNKSLQTISKYLSEELIKDPSHTQQLTKYTKSTALYSIMTYILAIGDRHMENLLMQPNGKLFHIDFGWLFNRDPKIKIPMKISKEMVDVMGGVESQWFQQFMSYLVTSFLILRKEANYLCSLLLLLKGSGIKVVEEDIVKNFDWLQQRFCLDLDDDEASLRMMQIVNQQLSAVFPKIVDSLHRWIQNQRK